MEVMQSWKERRKPDGKKTRRRCSKTKRPQKAVSTHRGDSWPAQQPPYWHSADSCGSVPCAPPVNCAACSSGHSSCTCEAYPLWKEQEHQVKSTATHFLLSKKSHLCNKHSRDGKTPKKGYSSPRSLSQPHFPTAYTSLPPAGYFAPSVFHTNVQHQQKEKEVDLLVVKQINRWQEGKTNQTAESHPSTACVSPSLVGKKLLRHFAHGTNSCHQKNGLPQ